MMRNALNIALMLGAAVVLAAATYLWAVRGNAIILDLGGSARSFFCL
jgi:hypothetical protein